MKRAMLLLPLLPFLTGCSALASQAPAVPAKAHTDKAEPARRLCGFLTLKGAEFDAFFSLATADGAYELVTDERVLRDSLYGLQNQTICVEAMSLPSLLGERVKLLNIQPTIK